VSALVSRLFRPWAGPYTDNPAERVLRFLPMLVYMCIIYAASAVPGEKIPVVINDKIAHTIEYFIFGILIALFVAGFVGARRAGHPFGTVLFGAFYAATDEFHQRFVPQRSPSFADFGCDLLGVSLAVLVIWVGVRAATKGNSNV
jgi:VanZ family protein